MIGMVCVLVMCCCAICLYVLIGAVVYRDKYNVGRKSLRNIAAQNKETKSLWEIGPIDGLTTLLSKIVYLDEAARDTLTKQLQRVGYSVSPEKFTARKYIIVLAGVFAALFCAATRFWIGLVIDGLAIVYGIMRQRALLTDQIEEKNAAVSEELPRFVRTICQQLHTNRDIPAALQSYRKVAGKELGAELDILLINIKTGGISSALRLFQNRLPSDDIFRLCGALMDIDRGIDQSATLAYLADDMARTAKSKLQAQMAKLPQKMRLTYIPAVIVAVVIIFYVLGIFVMNSLNTIF